jgi:membrane-associated HD superfamily phosphohydrolase
MLTPEDFEKRIVEAIDVNLIKNAADSLEVSTETEAKTAVSMTLQARKLKQKVDASRKEIVKPFFEYQKAINKIVKELDGTFEQIEENLRKKLNEYNDKRKEQPFENLIDLEIKVEDGVLFTQKKWDFNIDDSRLVPTEYMIIDERKIKEAISSGVRNIPGVSIFEKKELVMKIKN